MPRSAVSTIKDITTALHQRAGFECLEDGGSTVVKGVQLRLLGRVGQSAEKSWKRVRNQIHMAVRAGKPWSADISRWYFPLEGTDSEVFAWRVLFQGPNIEQHFADIFATIIATPVVASVDVTEFPIPRSNQRNLSIEGGKRGATAITGNPFVPGRRG